MGTGHSCPLRRRADVLKLDTALPDVRNRHGFFFRHPAGSDTIAEEIPQPAGLDGWVHDVCAIRGSPASSGIADLEIDHSLGKT